MNPEDISLTDFKKLDISMKLQILGYKKPGNELDEVIHALLDTTFKALLEGRYKP